MLNATIAPVVIAIRETVAGLPLADCW